MNLTIKSTQLPSSYRETHCKDCALHLVCLPPSVQESELPQLDAIIERGHPLQRGEQLFNQNDKFQKIYAVRSGAIKSTVVMDNGTEQITGFYLPGDIIGLDSIGNDRFVSNAYALETTSVCAIPYPDLKILGKVIPSLQDHILGLMGQEIRQGHQVMSAVNKLNAQERVAMFLVSMSTRYQRRRLSGEHFFLPMTRGDIANYLGLTLETVSRVFAQFQQNNVVAAQGKDIRILDRHYLCQLLEVGTVSSTKQ